MCDELGDASGLPKLIDLLRDRGWSEHDLTGLAHGNWMRVLGRNVGLIGRWALALFRTT